VNEMCEYGAVGTTSTRETERDIVTTVPQSRIWEVLGSILGRITSVLT
jgi:hypothetical protein